jgi:membrane fusion protein, heavy metal efflux system
VGNNAVSALPSDAIVDIDGKDCIFIAGEKSGEFEVVEVKKGVSSNGFTEVSLPVQLDAKTVKIVVKGTYSLLAKIKIGKGEEE